MRERLETILLAHLKAQLPDALKSMLAKGHTDDDRHIPYISLDVGEIKPFGELAGDDGIFEAEVSIAIADSAHDIRYGELFKRIRSVISAFADFAYEDDEILVNALWYEGEDDARDENNMGCVLTYKAVMQF